MKSIELLSIGIRLLGIYAFLVGFQTAAFQYQSIQQFGIASNDVIPMYAYVGCFVVILIFCVALLMVKFPTLLAKWLVPNTSGEDIVLDGSAKDIQTALFCVIGVYILSWAIPDFFNNALWLWYATSNDEMSFGSIPQYIIPEIVTVIELGIGLLLCLKSRGISQLFWRLRTAGAK